MTFDHSKLVASFVFVNVLNYGFSLAASRILAPGDYGVLGVAQSLLIVAGILLFSAVPWSLARMLPVTPLASRGSLVRGALLANTCVAAAVGLVVVLLYAAGPLRDALEQTAIVASLVVSFPVLALLAVARATAQGYSSYGRLATLHSAEAVVKVTSGLALAVIAGAVGAVLGTVIGALIATAVGVVMLDRVFGVTLIGRYDLASLTSASPMLGSLFAISILLHGGLLAVKVLVAERALAGEFQVALVLASAPYYLASFALVPVQFTSSARARTLAGTRAALASALRLSAVLCLPALVGLALFPDLVIHLLFAPEYAGAVPVLRALAVGNIALIACALLAVPFLATRHVGIPAGVLLVTSAVYVALLIDIVPSRLGLGAAEALAVCATGAAITLVATYVVLSRRPAERRAESVERRA